MNHSFLLRRKELNSLKRLRTGNFEQEKWLDCSGCDVKIEKSKLMKNNKICPHCGNYFSMTAAERIQLICDDGSFKEMNKKLGTKNPIKFPGYMKKLAGLREKTGMEEGMITGVGKIEGRKVAIGVLDSSFLMGSMGTVVGEKILRLAEHATKKRLPLIIFSASGGARMQEGLFSLMQMAKTSGAVELYKRKGGLFISCLTHPTTGGVSASYASLGDIMIAEPKALIGFAGPRVIQQTIGQQLPEGFQSSEFLLSHGMLDMIVERKELKSVLARLLRMHGKGV